MIKDDIEAIEKANELASDGMYVRARIDDERSKRLDMKVWGLERAQSLEGSMDFIAEDGTLFKEAVLYRSPENHETTTHSAYESGTRST